LSYSLRRAVPVDAPTLAVLAERTFRDAFGERNSPSNMDLHCERYFGPDIQAREISDRGIVTTLALASGHLIGFTQMMPSKPQPNIVGEAPGGAQPDLCRRRLAGQRRLAGAPQGRDRKRHAAGADCLGSACGEHNPRAIAFYRKSGSSRRDALLHAGRRAAARPRHVDPIGVRIG
jgi:hypothetical protein